MLIEGIDYRRTRGLDLLGLPDARRYVTLRTITAEALDWTITVEAGFDFDGPTGLPLFRYIPGLKTWTRATLRASLIHDGLYEPKGLVTLRRLGNPVDRKLTRGEADLIFRELCRQDGVPSWLAWLASSAILTLGGMFWQDEDGVYR